MSVNLSSQLTPLCNRDSTLDIARYMICFKYSRVIKHWWRLHWCHRTLSNLINAYDINFSSSARSRKRTWLNFRRFTLCRALAFNLTLINSSKYNDILPMYYFILVCFIFSSSFFHYFHPFFFWFNMFAISSI